MRPPAPLIRRFAVLRFFLVLAVGLAPFPASADDARESLAPLQAAIRRLVREEMDEHDVPALSLALVDAERVLWAEGFGFADRRRRIKATPETLFVAGNLTQALTATLALQLAEHGAFELDEPLPKLLPEFSIRSRFKNPPPITPRHLLSHHGGLPAMHFRDMWAPHPEPFGALVARLKDEYVAYPPGHVYVPSFPGYDVLGQLIEAKCGESFAGCMEKHLLAPLGMKRSTLNHARADRRLFARHYWSKKEVAFTAVRDVPAAGLVSNVLELGAFAQMLLAEGRHGGRTLLKPRSVAEMLRVQNGRVPLDIDNDIGLPWHLSGVHFPQARTVAWLENSSPFARGRIVLLPEHRLAVVLLANSSGSSDAVRKVSERLLELALEQRAAPSVAAATPPGVTRPSAPPRREDIVGHYATMLGQISVRPGNSGYRALMLGKTLVLEQLPDGTLAPEYRLLGILPIPIDVLKETRLTTARIGGRHLAVAYYRDRAYRLGERIQPVTLSAAWRKRLGEYQAAEHDELLKLVDLRNVSLAYTDGLLHFRYRVPGWLGLIANVPVRPVSDTELVVEGTGWLMGETVHVVQRDGKEALRYSGYEFRRVGNP
jgi:CubicO group peptidase (beta-lactamase class C family)